MKTLLNKSHILEKCYLRIFKRKYNPLSQKIQNVFRKVFPGKTFSCGNVEQIDQPVPVSVQIHESYGADPPGDEADPPGDEADPPGDEADPPGDEANTPGDKVDPPGDEADIPGDEANPPEDEANPPEDEADTPGDEAYTPGNGADTPGDEADPPGDEADTPGVEADQREKAKYFCCENCSIKFTLKRNLSRHIREACKLSANTLCEVCGLQFKSMQQSTNHKKTHLVSKFFNTLLCKNIMLLSEKFHLNIFNSF